MTAVGPLDVMRGDGIGLLGRPVNAELMGDCSRLPLQPVSALFPCPGLDSNPPDGTLQTSLARRSVLNHPESWSCPMHVGVTGWQRDEPCCPAHKPSQSRLSIKPRDPSPID